MSLSPRTTAALHELALIWWEGTARLRRQQIGHDVFMGTITVEEGVRRMRAFMESRP